MAASSVVLDNKTHSDLVDETNLMGTKEYHCNSGDLMGGLGLVVQAVLAFLAFTSLIGEINSIKVYVYDLHAYLHCFTLSIQYTYNKN